MSPTRSGTDGVRRRLAVFYAAFDTTVPICSWIRDPAHAEYSDGKFYTARSTEAFGQIDLIV